MYEFGTKRCGGTSVLQLIAQLQYQNLDPPAARTCIYDVGVMSVVGQTRDGWTMATLSSFGAAFRADRAYVNGAMIRDKRAIFLGVEPFDMANGGGQNIATFELTDAAPPSRQVPSREDNAAPPGRAMPSTEPVRSDVERLVNAQAVSLTSTADAFVDSYSDSAVAFFPQSLTPFEGRAKIIEGSRQAWRLHGTPTNVKTSAVVVGVAGSVAWATTTWTVTLANSSVVMPVRVTEILSRDANGLNVTAASFSVPPAPNSTGIYETPPGFGAGITPTEGSDGWLATPAQLAQSVLNDPATSLIGSDLKEYAIGGDTVRKLLTSWKSVRLDLVGNVRIVNGDGYKVVLAFARWPGPKPTMFRVLALFVRGEAAAGSAPSELATVHYSVAVAAQPQ